MDNENHQLASVADGASPTWRRTLFLYDGSLRVINHGGGIHKVVWNGSVIPAPDCADARRAAVPNGNGYVRSNIKFYLEGTASISDYDFDFRSSGASLDAFMNHGDGVDYVGEGIDFSGKILDEIYSSTARNSGAIMDDVHHLCFCASSNPRENRVVVGVGRNLYGNFLETGWATPCSRSFPHHMIVARRYLADDDVKCTWSLTMLKSQILLGLAPLLDEDPWSFVLDFVGSQSQGQEVRPPWQGVPWRNLAFHSAKPWRQLVQWNDKGIVCKMSKSGLPRALCGPPGPCLTPTPDGEPFQLVASNIGYPSAVNTTWQEQCCGCGGPCASNNHRFDYTVSDNRTEVYSFGLFCREECVARAVPAFVECLSLWNEHHIMDRARRLWSHLNISALLTIIVEGLTFHTSTLPIGIPQEFGNRSFEEFMLAPPSDDHPLFRYLQNGSI